MAISSGAVRAGRAFVEISADNTKFNHALHEAEATFRNFGSQLTQTSAQMLASMSAITAPFALSAKFYAEFDDVMRSVYSTAGKIAKVDMNSIFVEGLPFGIGKQARLINLEFKNLTNTARQLGATTSYTAKEAANSMLVLARAGFQIAEIQDSVRHILNLARATGTEVSEATQIMIGALRSFNIEARKSEQVVDLLVATANSSPQALSDIGAAMKYIGPVAKSLHLSLRDTLADLGALANFNIKGEQGGTALRNIYLRLASAKNQAKLKETFGVDILDDTGEFRKIVPVLQEIQGKIKEMGMSTAEVANSFKEIFGMRSAPAALSLMNADLTRIEEALESVTNLAEDQAHMMDEGLGGAIRMLISRFQELQIAITNAFSGPASIAIKGLTVAFRVISSIIEHNKNTIKVITAIVGAVGLVTAGFGAMSLAIGVATRSVSSLMTQIRKLSIMQPTRWFDSSIVRGKTSQIGTNDIQIKQVDRAREATRYLQENVSGLSKQVVRIIERFNRLGDSFDLIARKSDGFKKAMLKTSDYVRILTSESRPLDKTFDSISERLKTMTMNFNASRSAMNRNSQESNRLNGSFNALRTVILSIEKIFDNYVKVLGFVSTYINSFREDINLAVVSVKDFRDNIKGLHNELKKVVKAGKDVDKAFKTVASRINSATNALSGFNDKITELAKDKNTKIWGNIKSKVDELTGSFKALAGAIKLIADSMKRIGRMGSRIKSIFEGFITATNKLNKEDKDKLISASASEAKENSSESKSKGKGKGKGEGAAKPKEQKKPSLDVTKEELQALLEKCDLLNKVLDSLKTGTGDLLKLAKAIARFFRIISNGINKVTDAVASLGTELINIKGYLETFVLEVEKLESRFNELSSSIKTAVSNTEKTVRALKRVRTELKGLSLKKVISDTDKLSKGMVLLGDSMKYIVINRTQVESSIIGIGSAFEKAAVGALTMSQAVKEVVKGLKSLPKLANIEKKLKSTDIGKRFSERGKQKGKDQSLLTDDQFKSLESKVAASARRSTPNYSDRMYFVDLKSKGGRLSLNSHFDHIRTANSAIRKANKEIDVLREKDKNYEETQMLNRDRDRMSQANTEYMEFVKSIGKSFGKDRTNSKQWGTEIQNADTARTTFEAVQKEMDKFIGDKITVIEGDISTKEAERLIQENEMKKQASLAEGYELTIEQYKAEVANYKKKITEERKKGDKANKSSITRWTNAITDREQNLIPRAIDQARIARDESRKAASEEARLRHEITADERSKVEMETFKSHNERGLIFDKHLSDDEIIAAGLDHTSLKTQAEQFAQDYYDKVRRGERTNPYSIAEIDRFQPYIDKRVDLKAIADKSLDELSAEISAKRAARNDAINSMLFDRVEYVDRIDPKTGKVVTDQNGNVIKDKRIHQGLYGKRYRETTQRNIDVLKNVRDQLVNNGIDPNTDKKIQGINTIISKWEGELANYESAPILPGTMSQSNINTNKKYIDIINSDISNITNTGYNGIKINPVSPVEYAPDTIDINGELATRNKKGVTPGTLTSFQDLVDAGYLNPEQAQGVQWKDAEVVEGGLRDQEYKQKRADLSKARAGLRTEQSKLVLMSDMQNVLGQGGTFDQLNESKEKVNSIQKGLTELEELRAKQGLTAKQEADYWQKSIDLIEAQKDLNAKQDAHNKALKDAQDSIASTIQNLPETKDFQDAIDNLEKAERRLEEAKKIGSKKDVQNATADRDQAIKDRNRAQKAFESKRDRISRYGDLKSEVSRSAEDVKLAEEAVANVEKYKEAIILRQEANSRELEAAKIAKENAENNIKAINEQVREGGELSEVDKDKYEKAEKVRDYYDEEIKRIKQEQKELGKKRAKATAQEKDERKQLKEARAHQARANTAFNVYGPMMPGSPEAIAKRNKGLYQANAYFNAAKAQFLNNEAWKAFASKMKMFKQNMVDIAKFLGHAATGFRKTGKGAEDAAIRLRAAAAGFNVLNFCAATFFAITQMIMDMLGMAIIMAIVSAVISLLTWIGGWVKDLFTKSGAEIDAEREESGRQKFSESFEKGNDRVERKKEEREATNEKIDQLKELSKKETLTEYEAGKAEKLNRQLSKYGENIFTKHARFNERGQIVYDNTIDLEALERAKKRAIAEQQIETFNALKTAADDSPLYFSYSKTRRGYIKEFKANFDNQMEEMLELGPIEDKEALKSLKDLLDEIEDEIETEKGHNMWTLDGFLGIGHSGEDYLQNQKTLEEIAERIKYVIEHHSSLGSEYDVSSLIEAQQPFENDLNEAISHKKLDIEEVSEAYTAYIDKLSEDLKAIQDNFDTHTNKTEMEQAQEEINKKLDKTYQSYLAMTDKLLEELENMLPSWGAEADLKKNLDDSSKSLDNYAKYRDEQLKIIKSKTSQQTASEILNINQQYKKYQTREEIDKEINDRIKLINAQDISEENKKELIQQKEAERTRRKTEFALAFYGEDNDQNIESEEEFVKAKKEERDKKIAEAQANIEQQQKDEEEAIQNEYNSNIASVFNVFQSSIQQALDKQLEQATVGIRSNFIKAQTTRQSRLSALDQSVDLQVARDFAQRTYDLKYNSDDLTREEKQQRKQQLKQDKETARQNYIDSDEYKKNVEAINEEYKESINPEKLLSSIPTFQDAFINEEEQKRNIQKGVQDWHDALAENAVKDLQEQLDAENAKNPNEQNAATIDNLTNEIKQKRDNEYKKTQQLADELERDLKANLEKQTTVDMYSKQYAQNKFKTSKANQATRQLDIANLDQMIKTQQRIKDEATEGSDEFNAAVSRLAELNVLKSMAEDFNKAADQMEALKAEYARRQYDFGLKHFGLKDDALTLEEEHKTKLAEMDKEFQERFDAAETPEDKNQLKENYEAYKDFVNKQFEFKKANFANDDLVNPFKKKASEITTKYQDKILQSLVANGFGLDDIVMDKQGNLKAKEGAAKEVQSIIDLGERERDREIDALKNDFSHPFQQKAKEITKSYQDKILEALDANGLSRDVIKFDEEGNVKTQNATARRIADMMEALRNSEIEAQKDDFTDPTKKKVAEIKATWQKDIIEALDANGIKHVWVDPKTGKISAGANAKGNALIRIGEATRDAQIAATEFENKKKQRDYEVKSNAYQTTKPIINEIEIAIANLEVMSTGNQQVDQALELEIKQLQYNKAVLEARQFDERLVELQQLEADALKIWKAATARGANQEEVQKAFERYASLADEVQSTRTSMIDAFREVATSRKDFQQAMNQATNTVEKQSSGTFKAVEAARNSGNWRRENAIKQTFLLKQIADNTSYVDIV